MTGPTFIWSIPLLSGGVNASKFAEQFFMALRTSKAQYGSWSGATSVFWFSIMPSSHNDDVSHYEHVPGVTDNSAAPLTNLTIFGLFKIQEMSRQSPTNCLSAAASYERAPLGSGTQAKRASLFSFPVFYLFILLPRFDEVAL